MSFVIGLIVFTLVMLLITILYGLISYFWVPSLILGERDLVTGLSESAKLGFKNILYLITLVVIQIFVNGILTVINEINPESSGLVFLVMVGNYIMTVYFGLFNFVWFDGLVPPPVAPEEHEEENTDGTSSEIQIENHTLPETHDERQ